MLIYLDDYRNVKSAKFIGQSRYDEELLCANWNPALSLIALSCDPTAHEPSPTLPEDTAMVEQDFMDRVYALATQI